LYYFWIKIKIFFQTYKISSKRNLSPDSFDPEDLDLLRVDERRIIPYLTSSNETEVFVLYNKIFIIFNRNLASAYSQIFNRLTEIFKAVDIFSEDHFSDFVGYYSYIKFNNFNGTISTYDREVFPTEELEIIKRKYNNISDQEIINFNEQQLYEYIAYLSENNAGLTYEISIISEKYQIVNLLRKMPFEPTNNKISLSYDSGLKGTTILSYDDDNFTYIYKLHFDRNSILTDYSKKTTYSDSDDIIMNRISFWDGLNVKSSEHIYIKEGRIIKYKRISFDKDGHPDNMNIDIDRHHTNISLYENGMLIGNYWFIN